MNQQLRRLLEAFDRPAAVHGRGMTLEELRDHLPGGLGCDLAELRALAESLIGCGWLRRGMPPAADTAEPAMTHTREHANVELYERTEDGRLALASPLDVTLYTRPGCHLCEEAKERIAPLLRRVQATLREINIDADPVLRERYDFDVPVILLGDRKIAKHRVDVEQFTRQLEQARRDNERLQQGTSGAAGGKK